MTNHDSDSTMRTVCPLDGEPLSTHIGGKPCVAGMGSAKWIEKHRREAEAKRAERLWGDQ